VKIHKIKKESAMLKAYFQKCAIKRIGTLWIGKRLCVPKNNTIRDAILWEAHESAYSIHPSSTKTYLDLKEKYWWYGLKRDVAEYVALCDTCQRVKT
jgi:hypothetical protein